MTKNTKSCESQVGQKKNIFIVCRSMKSGPDYKAIDLPILGVHSSFIQANKHINEIIANRKKDGWELMADRLLSPGLRKNRAQARTVYLSKNTTHPYWVEEWLFMETHSIIV